MPTSRIVIKVKDEFFLQEETAKVNIATKDKVIVSKDFFAVSNTIRIKGLYTALNNAGNIAESKTIFTNLIIAASGLSLNGKLESLFSVIDANEAVNLMQMANDRSSSYIGEDLLNYYFIEVNTADLGKKLKALDELKSLNKSGIDYFYVRGELANVEETGEVDLSSVTTLLKAVTKSSVKSNNFIEPTNLSRSEPTKFLNKEQQSLVKQTETLPAIDESKRTTELSIVEKINTLFSNYGIDLSIPLSNEIKVIDMEQGWHTDTTINYATLGGILGGGINKQDKAHGQKTLNVLLGKTTYTNRLKGLCVGAKVQQASTWYSTTDERREAALTSTLNNIAIGDILLLELQTTVVGFTNYLPVEIEPAMYNVIKLGVNAKFIIVEAAGNGGYDLNTLNYSSSLKNLSTNSSGTGAIMVGGIVTDPLQKVNTGLRIDYKTFADTLRTSNYIEFQSTSLASAIVAALIANFQNMAMKPTPNGIARKLKISEIKTVLKNPPPSPPISFKTYLNSIGIY
jgi:hypothetical protein